jgi:hypothetical protein
MNRNFLFFGLASVAALIGSVAACSSTTTTQTTVDDGGAAADGGTSKDAGKDTSTTEPEDSGTPTDPDKACAAEATLPACGQCCVTNHPSGYKVFQDSLLGCACTGTGADGGAPCAADCANTACMSPPGQPDAKCNACLQGSVGQTGACNDAVGTACGGNPDCLAQQKCIAPCQTKPQQ